jgi:hypothetical protein
MRRPRRAPAACVQRCGRLYHSYPGAAWIGRMKLFRRLKRLGRLGEGQKCGYERCTGYASKSRSQ